MADAAARNQQYEYKANSNLVMHADTRLIERRPRDEATGEVMSLTNKLSGSRMGDKFQRTKPGGLKSEKSKIADDERRRKKLKESYQYDYSKVRGKSLANDDEDSSKILYRPRSLETKQRFEALLALLRRHFHDEKSTVLHAIAEEFLKVLKDEKTKPADKREEVKQLCPDLINNNEYNMLVQLADKITDFDSSGQDAFPAGGGVPGLTLVDDLANDAFVNVQFGDSDEEDVDGMLEEIKDEDDEDALEGQESEEEVMQTQVLLADQLGDRRSQQRSSRDARSGNQAQVLQPREIGAYWLQGELKKYYNSDSEMETREKAEKALEILESDKSKDQIEGLLLQLLGWDMHTKLIKKLRDNRQMIVWCTRLSRASIEQKKVIREQMRKDDKLKHILRELGDDDADQDDQNGNAMVEDMDLDEDYVNEQMENRRATQARQAALDQSSVAQPERKVINYKMLDLDDIAFSQGSHFMANKRCDLPEGSERRQMKGYEEIHIPAAKRPSMDSSDLIPISKIPVYAQAAFQGATSLNFIQSAVYERAMKSDQNLLLCAPTGAGKTNCAMLTIMREIGKHIEKRSKSDNLRDYEQPRILVNQFKIIYVAPMKSLVQEMVDNFSKRLKSYGIIVRELTGDNQLTREQIDESQIIVCTPEKWDIITRKGGEKSFTQLVRLIIFDEIHLLHDERGPIIEALVIRLLRNMNVTQENVRLVGLSATLPNYEDVARFLRVQFSRKSGEKGREAMESNTEDDASGLFFFDNSVRPVPLRQQFIGITEKKAIKRFQIMNRIVYEKVLATVSQRKQVLVFVHSRKDTAKTAKAIRDTCLSEETMGMFQRDNSSSAKVLEDTVNNEQINNQDLKDLLPYGFAIHHAGMTRLDRNLVEDLFKERHIQVLVSTATLAWGVNLPAHTVIIKGTQVYNPDKGRWTELGALDVLQMIGRAGRPQFDNEGEGILITQHSELQYYLSLLNKQLPVESQLVSALPNLLNAEIVLGNVQNVKEGAYWLGYSYLFIRMLKDPLLYSISHDTIREDRNLEKHRQNLIYSAALILEKSNLIKFDRRTGQFQTTELGRIASHYYCTHQTINTYNQMLKPTLSEIELFRVFSLSGEFRNITIREEERLELQKLMERVPIPVKESMDEPSAKVNVLLQAYISKLKLEGLALIADMVYVTQSAGRLMRAIHEIVLHRGWAQLCDKTLALCKMVDRQMWTSMCPLRQFKKIPDEIIRKLEKKSFPFDRMYELDVNAIGELLRLPKQGKSVHKCVHQIPKLELKAQFQPITRSVLRIQLEIACDFIWDEKIHGKSEGFWILVEDIDQEMILHHEFFLLKQKYASDEGGHFVTFYVPILEPLQPQYFIRVVSDRWIGSEATLPISFRPLILPEKYIPPTELMDLQPLPVTALENPLFQSFYRFRHFNSIQTQVFNTLYKSDENVCVGAPVGSGKTVCAELAIMRLFNDEKRQELARFNKKNAVRPKCVYVASNDDLARLTHQDWQSKFGQLGIKIALLSGDAISDRKELGTSHLVIATPTQWDVLSRQWKQREAVKAVDLFIIDDLHLLGEPDGHVLEVICSRMCYISYQIERKIRTVALFSSLANARNVARWLRCNPSNLFNFHPSVRPVKLELHIRGFNQTHNATRLAAMIKPAYQTITLECKKSVLLFVPTRKIASYIAQELLTLVNHEERDLRARFLNCSSDYAEVCEFAERLSDKVLAETIVAGIAFLHEGLLPSDREIVETLFSLGAIQVLICSQSLCYRIQLVADLVIIVDTQLYNGQKHVYEEFPISSILQMIGCAGSPSSVEGGKCVLFCQQSKKNFYKKFLYEPLPIESCLDKNLHDHFNAEIVTKTISNKQDALDNLTWTFFYHRLDKNPNYYNLQGVTPTHLSESLSELVENTLNDLAHSRCIDVSAENDFDLAPLNLGMISAYYYIQYETIDLFATLLNERTKIRGLIEVISRAFEFRNLPMRQHEDRPLRALLEKVPNKPREQRYNEPSFKCNLLLQAHLSRVDSTFDQRYPELESDTATILPQIIRLIQACVDVLSSDGHLKPALQAMVLSQMVTQAVWNTDSDLKQIPHMTSELIHVCKHYNVNTVFDFSELMAADAELKARQDVMSIIQQDGKRGQRRLQAMADFCNRYPSLQFDVDVPEKEKLAQDGAIEVTVLLGRDDEDEAAGPVVAPFFPQRREEGWWVVIGDESSNKLMSVKRISQQKMVKLAFPTPEKPGTYEYTVFLMSDCYTGCDMSDTFTITVRSAGESRKRKAESDSE